MILGLRFFKLYFQFYNWFNFFCSFLHPVQGPAWRCLEPQLAAVPAGFSVACGTLLQRATAVSRAFLGLPAAVLSSAVPAARSLPEPGSVLPRQRPILPELPAPEPTGSMGSPSAARPHGGPDGELRSAGAASGLAAPAIRVGPTAGLRRCKTAWCASSLRSPRTGAWYGRRTATRAARYGGYSGKLKAQLRFAEIECTYNIISDFPAPIMSYNFKKSCLRTGRQWQILRLEPSRRKFALLLFTIYWIVHSL